MAKYKEYSYTQGQFIPVHFNKQILPGTFEYTLTHLIDNELDLSVFDRRYRNEDGGAPAYDPRILLKVILFAYSRGIVSSRKIGRCCEENIVFMALSANTRPHFTTIADFIATMDREITELFRNVLLVCNEMGLIGKEMFAIDGCRLPSNASKEWSGTRQEFMKKKVKLEKAIGRMLVMHRVKDRHQRDKDIAAQETKHVATLQRHAKKLKEWLDNNDDKLGRSGKPRKSNITDNDSAKMKSSHGIIQGYDGVAVVDSKHQVVVAAEAFGEAEESGLLEPMVSNTRENLATLGQENVLAKAKLTADSGFHTEKNLEMLANRGIDGYIADKLFRKRDPRFAGYERYKERSRKEYIRRKKIPKLFSVEDFIFDKRSHTCYCPAGKQLCSRGKNLVVNGYRSMRFRGRKTDCQACQLRAMCLRYPDRTESRQVNFFFGRSEQATQTYTEKMKRKIDSAKGRRNYQRRIGTVEPVFANIKSALGLNRFTLRGKHKVNVQWLLYCLVHNIGKIQRFRSVFS